MNIDDDPNLTAYALDELDPAERAAIEELLRAEPAATSEVSAVRELAARLRADLATEEAPGLTDDRRAALLGMAKMVRQGGGLVVPSSPAATISAPFWRSSWFPMAAAAGVVLAAGAGYYFSDYRGPAPEMAALKSSPAPAPTAAPTFEIAMNAQERPSAAPAFIAVSPAPVPSDKDRASASFGSAQANSLAERLKMVAAKTAIDPLAPMPPQSAPGGPTPPGALAEVTPPAAMAPAAPSLAAAGSVVGSIPAGNLQPSGAVLSAAPDGAPAQMRSEKTYAPYAADGIATKAAKRGGFIAARDQAVVKLWMSEDSSSELPAESSAPAAASMSRSTAATAVKQLSSAPASVNMEVASCPWAAGNRLVRIALGSGSAPGEPSGEAASVQIRFDPKQVAAYRVLSEGRSGSGGALIEIIPADVENEGARRGGKPSVAAGRAAYAPASVVGRAAAAGPLLTLITSTGAADWRRVREHSLSDSGKEWKESSPAFLWSAGAAGAELLLEDSPFKGTATWKLIEELVRDGAKGQPEGRARQMFELIEKKKAGK